MFPIQSLRAVRPLAQLLLKQSSRLSSFHEIADNCKPRIYNLHSYRYAGTATSTSKGQGEATNASHVPEEAKENSDELLEKMVTGLSADIHQKNRVYRNDLTRVLDKIKDIQFSTKKQGLLLLRCCADLLPDESPSSRMALVEQVWNTLKPHTKFGVEHYNELLRCYVANNRTFNVNNFIRQMAPLKPNITTYEFILKALGEAGDLNQATEVLSNMKALGIPATGSVFNSLIICQGKAGNLQNIDEVLTMMESLKLDKSIDTHLAIIKAYTLNKKGNLVPQEMKKAIDSGCQFEEKHVMEVVKYLANVGMYDRVPEVLKYLPTETLKSPSISAYMQSVSTQLVFLNHPLVALEIYKCLPLPSFGPKDDQGLHGRSLVRDCVKAAMPSTIIDVITQELMTSGRNPIALQSACHAALQLGRTPLALDLLARMKQLKMPLQPHYFWPVLLTSSKTYGEKGIMNILATMISMDVSPDYETILEYVLPYVSFSSPQNLMKKFIDNGIASNIVLTPMMVTLISSGQVRAASELSELFEAKIDSEKLLKPLVKGYLISLDVTSTVHVLEDMNRKANQKNKDWVGRFLCDFIVHKKIKEDKTHYHILLKALKTSTLRISTSATDLCLLQLQNQKVIPELMEELKNDIIAITDEHLVDESEIFVPQIPHPRSMDEVSLKAHLIELEAKGMNTRGVLRKLLQLYCREGKLRAAREILDKCQREDVYLSAGMKAAIFDLYVKLGELELAEMSLAELNKSSPNFTLDEFKLIDFATLMVYRRKIDKAFEAIKQQSQNRRVIGGRNVEMNCWRLLDAIAADGSYLQTHEMFNMLIKYGYCKPTNIILGPLIRVHLKSNNLEEAVNEFVQLSNKYSKTPLKHELLCKILIAMNDGKTEDSFEFNSQTSGQLNKLAQTVLNTCRKVHGPSDVQLTLIAALADVGYKKSLRKLLLDPNVKVHPEALIRRCERFADEKKLAAIETIAECAKDLRHIEKDDLYEIILSVYQREDDCQNALSLWYKMQEDDVTPSQKFVHNLTSLLKANNKTVPAEIMAFLDKKARSKILAK